MAQAWLVTGSSRGLGRAVVEAGLLAGNKVLATARDIESLRVLSERCGDQVKLFELDVTDESSAAGAVKTAIDALGSLDVVINNAGYGNLSSVEDTPMLDFRAQIETNLFGTIIVTNATLHNLGVLDRDQNRLVDARQHYEEALKTYRELAQKNPDTYSLAVASTLNNLGNLDSDQNRMAEAREHYEEALKIRRELAQKNPDTYSPAVASTLNNLGNLDRQQNRIAEARQHYKEALSIYKGLSQRSPDPYAEKIARIESALQLLQEKTAK